MLSSATTGIVLRFRVMFRKYSTLLLLTLICFITALLPSKVAAQVVEQPGFQQTPVITGLSIPTAVRFAPNGKVFVAEKNGKIKVFDSITDTTPTIFADFTGQIYTVRDHGLNSLAIDPEFPTRPYIYVAYSLQGNPGGRISRLTADASGNTMIQGSENVLVQEWCTIYGSHSMGDLRFGADKTLYASVGEGASFDFVDYGQTSNDDVCGDPVIEGGALRSQDLRTPADPQGLSGTIIRINPDTGAAATGNPLLGGRTDDDRIIAYGLRNPFRFYLDSTTNNLWVGDVGWNTWEELNRITNPLDGTVENFGWPCYEGAARQPGYDTANLPICEGLYTSADALSPFYTYNRAGIGGSLSAVSMYKGTSNYPSTYNGALFFGDYAQEWVKVMFPGTNGLPNPSNTQFFLSDINVVDLQIGPGGDLYALHIGTGSVHRIKYFAGNNPPVADINVDVASGPIPMTVHFDGSGSSDADGNPITYAWDLDGDGAFDDSTSPTPTYTYTTKGNVLVRLQVTDSGNATGVAGLTIYAGNTPPTATILTPAASLTYKVDDTITFSGSASDPDTTSLFSTFNPGTHPDVFNKVEKYFGYGTGKVYPYVGKSAVGRGADTSEANAPSPTGAGIRDMQMHPPDNAHLTVASFSIPETGTYTLNNLAVRRVDGTTGHTVRYRVFDQTKTQIANLQATSRSWVASTPTINLGTRAKGEKIYFTVDRDGAFYYDATEIAWSINKTSAPTKTWHSYNVTTQAGSPQGKVMDTSNTTQADLEFYESTNNGGVDLATGALPPSQLKWDIVLFHCQHDNPTDCHEHPVQTFEGVAGGSFKAPDHEYPSHMEIRLTATDVGGAVDTEVVRIDPKTTTITINSNPQGLKAFLYGTEVTTPFTRDVVVNAQTSISAPSPQTLNSTTQTFASWSDGGAQTHNITIGASPQTITATYTQGGSSSDTIWHSYNVTTQAGSPQASVVDTNGSNPANLELYESTNDGGVDQSGLFTNYTPGAHSDIFNKAEKFWSLATGTNYPYVGKSTVDRGSDTGESNTPLPLAVRDLQMHPSNTNKLTVASFTVPKNGTYKLSNLAVRRVDGNTGQTVRLKVFNAAKTQIANLQATSQAWTKDTTEYALGDLNAGDKIYFAVDRDGAFYYDATEIAWTITATSETTPPPTALTWNSQDAVFQAGTPQASIRDTSGVTPADLEVYESTNTGGVDKASVFSTFTSGAHPDAFNKVNSYWANAAGAAYPYVGKSAVDRGTDTGETNIPSPQGVKDLQMHPANQDNLVVTAFKVPLTGTYSVSNLAVRRVDGNAGQSARFKVFNAAKTQIANLQATSQAWATDPTTYTLGALNAGDYIYFAVDRDGGFYWDATEVIFTVNKTN